MSGFLLPSKNAHSLLLDIVLDGLIEPLAGPKADFDAGNSIFEGKITAHKLIETEPPARGFVYEYVHIGIRLRLVAGIGAKQIQPRDAVGSQLRLSRFELVNHFGAVHRDILSQIWLMCSSAVAPASEAGQQPDIDAPRAFHSAPPPVKSRRQARRSPTGTDLI